MKKINRVQWFAVFCILAGVLLSALGVLTLPRLQTHYSVMQFLPTHHAALKMDREVRKRFHLKDQPSLIGILTLNPESKGHWLEPDRIARLDRLADDLKKNPQVDQALSVANVEGASQVDGSVTMGELLKLVPKKDWRARIAKDALLTPNLIAEDERTVLLYVTLKTANVETLVSVEREFRQQIAQAFPEAKTSVGGVSAVQTDLGLLLNKELLNFLALTVLACAAALLLIFETYSTLFIPLLLTVFCNLMVFTMMALTGITFTILSSTIPIMVFIDVMTISCHILLRVHEEALIPMLGDTRLKLIWRVNRAIWLPNALGSLTTCVGFLTLLLSDVPLIRTFGLAVALSILISSTLTSVGIIPFLLLFPLPRPRAWVNRPARWALFIVKYKRAVVLGTLALVAGMAFVGRNLDWTGRLFDDLPRGQEARKSTERIDQSMGGVVPLEVVVRLPKGKDWTDPADLQALDRLMETFRGTGGIGSAQSLPDFLRASGLHGGALPNTRAAIAETYFMYGLSENNPLKQFLTNDNRSARIQMKIHDLPSDQAERLIATIRLKVRHSFPLSNVQIGGMGAIVHTIHNEISHELIFGFWQALLLIVALLTLVFRSLRWALVAALPNLITPIILLGALALTHTPIKPGVAIIFSIALGLAFTNTVYALNRLRELARDKTKLPVRKTFYLEANPCLISTLIVMMGFSVFLASYFDLNRTFGASMMVAILAGLLGDLVFLPALLAEAPWLLQDKPARAKVLNFEPRFSPKAREASLRAASRLKVA